MGIFRQFPYTNFHELNLDEIIKIMREMQDEWSATKTEWASYKDFIDNYFATLDVSEEVLAALRTMAASGELNLIMDPVIASEVADWLAANITPTTPAIDASLSVAGAGADAEVTGKRFAALDNMVIYEANIDATGNILPYTGYNVHLFKLNQFDEFKIVATGATNMVYSFFTDIPRMGDQAYNQTRIFVNGDESGTIAVATNNSWLAVRALGGEPPYVYVTNPYKPEGIQITSGSYLTYLPDADNAGTNTSYILTFAVGSTAIPANLPVKKINSVNNYLYCVGRTAASRVQFFASQADGLWYRTRISASVWGNWIKLTKGPALFIGTGQDYTTLRAGIAEAIKEKGTEVVVLPGTYNLLTEFSDVVSDPGSFSGYQGNKVENDVSIMFMPGAEVTFMYTGSHSNILTKFSPFFAGTHGGYKINGLNVKASNCRYCLHDDPRGVGVNTADPRHVVIKNCTMYIDNTSNATYPQCVGGGLTESALVEFENNYLESENANNASRPVASWHNLVDAGVSKIIAKDNYCEGYGSLRFNSYGVSAADTSLAVVTNNSVGSAIVNGFEDPNTYPNRNLKMVDWNNEVRP